MNLGKMPYFVWSIVSSAILLEVSVPVLAAGRCNEVMLFSHLDEKLT
jgi:heme/copper-type cytochrome/quinol oxidase subunit 1